MVFLSRVVAYSIHQIKHRLMVFVGREIAVLDRPFTTGETPLHLSVKMQSYEICENLLKAGANPNIRDLDGMSPLDTAELKKYESIAKLLKFYGALPSNRR